MRGTKVLVIDDDIELLQLMKVIFLGADAQVYTAPGAKEGLRQFYSLQPDLVVLDVMMPEMDGWQVCQHIRQVSDVPIILLTALGRTGEIVRGLECGADDYVTKPFQRDVLLARARAVLRRTALSPSFKRPVIYNDGYLTVDLEGRRVLVDGEPVKLSVTEYRMLAFMFRHADRLLTFSQILKNVWGEGYQGNRAYVHVYIRHLRQKLEPDPKNPKYFLSERGVGYRFEKQIP